MKIIGHLVMCVCIYFMSSQPFGAATDMLHEVPAEQVLDDLVFDDYDQLVYSDHLFDEVMIDDVRCAETFPRYLIEDIPYEDQLALSRGECSWQHKQHPSMVAEINEHIAHAQQNLVTNTSLQARLILAVSRGDVALVTKLIKRKLYRYNIEDYVNTLSQALLIVAQYPADQNRLTCAFALIQAGAYQDIRDPETGYRPLHYATYHNNAPLLLLLCQHDANLNYRDNQEELTPLGIALRYCSEEIKDILFNQITLREKIKAALRRTIKNDGQPRPRGRPRKQPPIQADGLR